MQHSLLRDIPDSSEEREAIILLSDMVNYSGKVGGMQLSEIRTYMCDYHIKIRELIAKGEKRRHIFEPTAGDGTVAIYGCHSPQDKAELANIAVDAAIRISKATAQGELPATRIGLYSGPMIEAILDNHVLRFTLAFAAARRLEKLCDYFQTSFLMGKEIAQLQYQRLGNIVRIGRVTLRHFDYPIHIYTIYEPGIHNCPASVDVGKLKQFIRIKNEAVKEFCGDNRTEYHKPDFRLVRERLLEADSLFQKLSGTSDIATRRLLEYIDENPLPSSSFITNGMRINLERKICPDQKKTTLHQTLIKSLSSRLFNTISTLQDRKEEFDLSWYTAGEVIFKKGDKPDGIYFIVTGSVRVEDPDTGELAVIKAGELFFFFSYFFEPTARTATIIAEEDLVVRKINETELEYFPDLKNLFKKIAHKRGSLPETRPYSYFP